MAPSVTLGYWKIRGFAQPIRFLCEYVGEDYKDKIYDYGSPDAPDRSVWLKDKFSLGLDFPNLPYYIDGNLKLTQSLAIIRHVARKHGLMGKPGQEAELDMLELQAMDSRLALGRLCYNKDFENLKGDYIDNLPTVLKMFSDYLGNKRWFTGDQITYVDFLIYEYVMYVNEYLSPGCSCSFENLLKFRERFENLEAVKKCMSSPKYISYPINGPTAYWGGK